MINPRSSSSLFKFSSLLRKCFLTTSVNFNVKSNQNFCQASAVVLVENVVRSNSRKLTVARQNNHFLRRNLSTALRNWNHPYHYQKSTSSHHRQESNSQAGGEQSTSNDFIRKSNDNSSDEVSIMKVLNVAEKNDAAKRIANLLGNGAVQTRNTFSKYNKLYEFDYQFRGQRCKMTMTSVSGHLLNYEFDAAHRKWHSCDPVELFDAPVLKGCTENMKDIKKTLEGQAPYFEVLIIWTDCDREGENIGFEIINVCRRINPRLQVFRAKFSEITKPSVTNAMNTLTVPDQKTSDAVDVRQELDLRIGAAFTRFQTLRLTRKFPALAERLISYGSCQFPTLGFVVERYRAIQDFVGEDFWKIDVTHNVDNMVVNFNWARVRLFEEIAVLTIFEACEDNPTARVVKVQSKPKNKWRPTALDTIEFEKLASRKLKIGAKEAMSVAEKLYTSGIISYPRTETNIFPPSLNLTELVQQQSDSGEWGGFATRLLQRGGPNPRNGKKTDQAHPPIHPTKFVTGLTGNEKKVYDLVVRHFLACCSKDAVGKETIVEIEISGEKFIANGLTVIERNYLEVYIYDKWSDKEIPDFEEGQTFVPTKTEMNNGRTCAPPLLTEADLIALMEKHGIGTDATHAEHIETIKTRQYVGLDGIHFIPGKLGMGLVEGYDSMGFEMSKPRLRAQLEADLQKICQGTRQPDAVLREQVRSYKQVFIQARDQVARLDEALAKLLNDAGAGGNPPVQPGGNGGNRGNAPPSNNPRTRRRNDDDDDDDGGYSGSGGGNSVNNRTTSSSSRSNVGTGARSTTNSNPRSFPANNSSVPTRPVLNQPSNNIQSDGVQCHCGTGNPPDIRTTRKEGPNYLRQFYKCDTCSFFQWVDQASNTSTQRPPASGYGTQQSSASSMGPPPQPPRINYPATQQSTQRFQNQSFDQPSRGPDSDDDSARRIPSCHCNKPANQYTVRKEGGNKGKKFFGCPVPYQSQEPRCDFFMWDEQANNENSSDTVQSRVPQGKYTGIGANRVARGGARGGGQSQGGIKRQRKCGVCSQTGHTRRNCPVAGGEDDDEDME